MHLHTHTIDLHPRETALRLKGENGIMRKKFQVRPATVHCTHTYTTGPVD